MKANQALEFFAASDAKPVASTANEKDGTIDVVWYTGAQVPRKDPDTGDPYMLTLDMGGARLDRLNAGAPVFDTRPGRLGSALVFVHEFSLYLRAPESPSVGYEEIFNWLVNDVPSGGSLSMLHTPVDANCEPMDFYLPSAQRNTVVISADGATFEYFEVRANLIESQNP
jgi:hypothetical protein